MVSDNNMNLLPELGIVTNDTLQTNDIIYENVDMNDNDDCQIVYPNNLKYTLALIGTCLSVVSVISNILIATVLLRPKHSHFFFLGLLAVSDTFLSIWYGPIIAVNMMGAEITTLWIHKIWWLYAVPLLALCNTASSFSVFLLILATAERYLILIKSNHLICFRSRRKLFAFLSFIFALLIRGTTFLEVTIVKNGDCTGILEYRPNSTRLAETWPYNPLFTVYIRQLVSICLPFVVLAFLNASIVAQLRHQHRAAIMFRFANSSQKAKVRSATRLLVFIVFSYLVANFLSFCVTIWEYIDFESTQSEENYPLYDSLTDLISVLAILVCALRIFIYLSCNQEIRNAFSNFFCNKETDGRKLNYELDVKPNNGNGKALQRIGTDFDHIVVVIARQRPSLVDYNDNRMTDLEDIDEIIIKMSDDVIAEALDQLTTEQIEQFKKYFNMFDKENKGYIRATQVGQILRTMGQAFEERDLKQLIKQFDADGSGEIEFEEFAAMVANFVVSGDDNAGLEEELREAFRLYDKEGNGYINVSDLREILRALDDNITEEELDEMITEIDSDGSGTVDFDEFMEMMSGE
ncbi:G protein-coupled receptor, rhodopsin-like family and EF-hand domain and EF-hand domain pair and GPCR, rhodopsin-like, 7TM domain-containing protein [Strongyloides ratti]|uniref:G protein-coupled receptor, rhodopsin-like family and EF-hand domain and EF-hand domain pair and GPCR, rhodopsin-like, 7TM domain-containing protein n=1 Tax=Strongyloides ratti TaxID=34506 RepID=A0A090KWJ0_STRRB|nr:G protein-coupled receptor, rhodopsin-like family and EF-hand domain and EF-hand domain pair and GPCR, rhodopsin-like, 7TM domain-containing protein [Strongyloides ratti]CEF60196.1 G protein-coupled receptor, rhodopsin-like family and EF-hand domain and EF-hand domain pair and GPCR, rhodopsin-like, 7TM domain-containing protein [Strongyloides ratti]